MSRFALYRSTGYSLKTLGIINKTLFALATGVFPAFVFISFIVSNLYKEKIQVALLAIWITSLVCLIIFSIYTQKHIKTIGFIDVTTTNITKTIGHFSENYEYQKIKSLNVTMHLRKILLPPNADKSKTYFLSIELDGKSKEYFVISSQSIDIPVVNFIETIKRIEKYLQIRLLK